MYSFSSLAEALQSAAQDVRKEGEFVDGVSDSLSVGSQFGAKSRPFWEIQGYAFTITNPAAVVIESSTRPISIPYMFANILWTAAGDDTVNGISYWNDRAAKFSDDGDHIRSAAGPRLFGKPSQYAEAVNRIAKDKSTRRAVITFIDSSDLTASTRDVPCTIGLQLLRRGGQLNAVGFMRSQSALMVMPYDIALLTTIQRLAASELGLDVGSYTHFSGSFHVYDDEMDLLGQFAESELRSHDLPDPRSVAVLKSMAGRKAKIETAERPELLKLVESAQQDSLLEGAFERAATLVLAGQALFKSGCTDDAKSAWNSAGELGRLSALGKI